MRAAQAHNKIVTLRRTSAPSCGLLVFNFLLWMLNNVHELGMLKLFYCIFFVCSKVF